MTPIGSKITPESAKTNRLQPCLLHSSLCSAHTYCHLRLCTAAGLQTQMDGEEQCFSNSEHLIGSVIFLAISILG